MHSRDLLEPFLSARFLVAVGMVFQRERPECVLDGFLIRVARNAQHFVVITLSYRSNRPDSGLGLYRIAAAFPGTWRPQRDHAQQCIRTANRHCSSAHAGRTAAKWLISQ